VPEMRKDLIIEISRYKELMGLQIITESDFSKKFVYPSNGKKVLITSPYGMRFNPVKKKYTMHHGLDLRAKQGSNILAIADGVVEVRFLVLEIVEEHLELTTGLLTVKRYIQDFVT